MREHALKMDEPGAIVAVLAEGGLDAGRLMQTAQEPAVKARLLENTEAAHARGAFGSTRSGFRRRARRCAAVPTAMPRPGSAVS